MERLVQRLEEMPEELQNIREELATFENGATGTVDKCQDILHGLFERVYEAIDIVKGMGGQSKEGEPDVVVIEDGDISGPMSTPAHPSNRQNKQTEDGVVANPRFRDPLEKFPKLRDLTRNGVYHGVANYRQIKKPPKKKKFGKQKDKFIDEYECFCSFKVKGYRWMNDHYFKATQPKNFTCPNCSQRFHFRRALQEHCKQLYKRDIFPCHICYANYFTQREFEAHTKTTDTECGRTLISKKKNDQFYFTQD